jgi:hypothetical protein
MGIGGTIYVAERDRLGPRRIPLVIKPTHRRECAMCGAPAIDSPSKIRFASVEIHAALRAS